MPLCGSRKGKNFEARLKAAYRELFDIVELVLPRTQVLLDAALGQLPEDPSTQLPRGETLEAYEELMYWHSVTQHVYRTASVFEVAGGRTFYRFIGT